MPVRKYYLFVILIFIPLFLSCNESGDSSADLPFFTNVTADAGISPGTNLGQTSVWGDFTVDGYLDLIFTNLNFSINFTDRNVFYYLNNGGVFEDITFGSGIDDLPIKTIAVADFNNDGLPDIIAGTNIIALPPLLYDNIGLGMFEEISQEAGINLTSGPINQTIWADYNKNGYVDLLQVTDGISVLYANNGDGTFSEVTFESGLGQSLNSRAAIWFDYNNNGLPDIFFANNNAPNTLYRNNGDGTFTNVTAQAGLGGDPGWRSVSACAGDYNRSGFLDLYVGNISSPRNALYRNNGDGTFTDVTLEAGTEDVGDARTCSWVDFDSDGNLDLYTSNHLNPTRLYRNLGNNRFRDVAPDVGLDIPIDVFSAAWGDYDNNGTMDVFVNGHLGTGLFRNSGNGNFNLIIELVGNGTTTNTSAIGARVHLGDSKGIQMREVSGGKGCCEQDMLPVHFGIGTDTVVDIMVEWTDGSVCNFSDFEVLDNTFLVLLQEGCELIVKN